MDTLRSLIFLVAFATMSAGIAQAAPPSTPLPDDLHAINVYQQALDYLLGRNGKSRSAEKAAALFRSLAEQNWGAAQHMLGNLYFRGQGVEKNDLLAYKWLTIAARNNITLSTAIYEKRKQLQQRLSSTHLQQVEEWIADWEPDPDLARHN